MKNIPTDDRLTIKTNELSEQKARISFLKDILNIEDERVTEINLLRELEQTVMNNFSYLVVLNSMLKEMPQVIKDSFENLSSLYEDELLYLRELKRIKNYFSTDSNFKLYENFVVQVLVMDILKIYNTDKPIEENTFKQLYLQEKKIYQCLIYEITNDFISPRVNFDTTNFVMNFHFILKWLKENKNNSKLELTNDECEIIAGLIYGLKPKEMFKLNFSSFVQIELDIEKIITDLPSKFKVKNLTQVMFKVFNIAPHIWCLKEHIAVIKTIKGLL